MTIQDVPFGVVDWDTAVPLEHEGEKGTSFWRTIEPGNVRIRRVEYSAGFKSDHWCGRGHVGLVLEGRLFIRLKDEREFALGPGMGFHCSDDEANPHLVYTEKKTTLFIVD
jgi:hypothetical protein